MVQQAHTLASKPEFNAGNPQGLLKIVSHTYAMALTHTINVYNILKEKNC